MKVYSNSFENNGMIPKKYTGYGEDKSPEIILSDIPEETISLAIILDDLDVPFTKNYNHWLAWNIPNLEIIPEGLPAGAEIDQPIKVCQGIGWGKNCYRGPKPPFFLKKAHRYVFYIYALDTELTLSKNTKKDALVEAMQGHILEEAQLTGLYKNDYFMN